MTQEKTINWLAIFTSLIALITSLSVAWIGYLQHENSLEAKKNELMIQIADKRDEKALDIAHLILSTEDIKREEGLLKLAILYRDDSGIQKEILDSVNKIKRIDEKKYLGRTLLQIISKHITPHYYSKTIRQRKIF